MIKADNNSSYST